jgi:caa(3)-type oxidase subunit IV
MAQEHPSKPVAARRPNYFLILIVLVVFTAIEVAASYLTGPIKIPVLIVLALTKASLVVLYFMHLKFDSRWFALWFILGLALISPLLLYLGALMPGH